MRRDLRAELIAHLVEVCPDALEHGGDIWSWFVYEVVAPRGSRAGQYRLFRVWRRERANEGPPRCRFLPTLRRPMSGEHDTVLSTVSPVLNNPIGLVQ